MLLWVTSTELNRSSGQPLQFHFEVEAESVEEFCSAMARDKVVFGYRVEVARGPDGSRVISNKRPTALGSAGLLMAQEPRPVVGKS